MLDYAANAVVYWPVETLRAQFTARCGVDGGTAEEALAKFLATDLEEEVFWERVKTNLQAGKVRMLFVADKIPTELRRIVEFLNQQMDPAEVFAVEIPQFVGQGLRTLVPQVYGGTETRTPPGMPWNEERFFRCLEEKCGAACMQVGRQIYDWARRNASRVWWGKGSVYGGFVAVLNYKGKDHQLFELWTYGQFEIMFQWYAYKPPFDSEEKRRELLGRFNSIPGVTLPEDSISRRPTINLEVFRNDDALAKLFETLEWLVTEIRSS